MTYVDSVEHRAAVYSLHATPDMREWSKADFLRWLAEHDRQVAEKAFEEGRSAQVRHQFNLQDSSGYRPLKNPYGKVGS